MHDKIIHGGVAGAVLQSDVPREEGKRRLGAVGRHFQVHVSVREQRCWSAETRVLLDLVEVDERCLFDFFDKRDGALHCKSRSVATSEVFQCDIRDDRFVHPCTDNLSCRLWRELEWNWTPISAAVW